MWNDVGLEVMMTLRGVWVTALLKVAEDISAIAP